MDLNKNPKASFKGPPSPLYLTSCVTLAKSKLLTSNFSLFLCKTGKHLYQHIHRGNPRIKRKQKYEMCFVDLIVLYKELLTKTFSYFLLKSAE